MPNQLDCLVGSSSARSTRWSRTTRWRPARPPRTRRSSSGGKPFTTEFYGVATKLGKDDLVRRVNKVLEDYRRGAWMAAYHKWLVADLPGITGPPAPKYRTG